MDLTGGGRPNDGSKTAIGSFKSQWCKGGTEEAEVAALPDAGISLKQCPEKNERQRKGQPIELGERRHWGLHLQRQAVYVRS